MQQPPPRLVPVSPADQSRRPSRSFSRLALNSSLGNDVSALTDENNGVARVRWAYSGGALKALIALFIILIVVLAALITIYARGEYIPLDNSDRSEHSSSANSEETDAQAQAQEEADQSASLDLDANIIVYVSGAVAKPGVVELPASSRVADAVNKAGGLGENAQQVRINLAAPLRDGQHIHVFAEGESYQEVEGASGIDDSSSADDSPYAGSPSGASGAASGSEGKVSLNSASAADLESVPGIGPVMAERIIAWREDNGNFTSVDQLLQIEGIGQKTLNTMKDYVSL